MAMLLLLHPALIFATLLFAALPIILHLFRFLLGLRNAMLS